MTVRQIPMFANCLLLAATLCSCRSARPRISPQAGTYNCPQTITVSDSTHGASIFYTTDGSHPQQSSPKYAGPFAVSNTDTVKAIAVAPPRKPSKIVKAEYVCTLTFATRRDFVVQLQQNFQLPAPKHATDFSDVTPTDPDYAVIEAAAPFMNMQILCRGCMLSKDFGPDLKVSRAGSTIAIVRLLVASNQLQPVNLAETNKMLSNVADADSIPSAARSYIATALKFGILTPGPDRKISMNAGYTRSEMTALLLQLGKQYGHGVGTIQ